MTIKYEPLCHDAERTMEDQVRLLAECAKRAFLCHQVVDARARGGGVGGGSTTVGEGRTGGGNAGGGGGASPSPEQELRWAMQALWNQLSETDIFMAGVHAGDVT